MPRRSTARPLSAKEIVAASFLYLIVGHLGLRAFFPSLAINAIGLVAAGSVLAWVLFVRRDVFAFVVALWVGSHFGMAGNQGGLSNLVSFLLLSVYLAKNDIHETGRRPDIPINLALAILFVWNSLGVLLRNPTGPLLLGQQFAAYTGILMAFYVASHLKLTEARIRKFAYVIGFMVIYDFFVSLNQHYSVIKISSPLLGLGEDTLYATTNAFGTFGGGSANGQYAMMMFVFLIPLICASVARQKLQLNLIFFGLVYLCCAGILVMANMRGPALEAGLAVLIYIAMFSVFYRNSFRYSKYLTRFTIMLIVLLSLFGAVIGIENISEDFAEVEITSAGDIFTGEGLNRGRPWAIAYDNLTERSWIIGYGHGVQSSNRIAWGGKKLASGYIMGGHHLHNLYLALPTLFGWPGAAAYVFIYFTIALRLFRTVRQMSFDRFPVVLALGFLMSIGFFLLEEIKAGNAVHKINYAMLAWIWMGLGLAAVRTARFERTQERMAAQASQQQEHSVSGAPIYS